jgi:menaquinone-dependent protoporphyrinogen oxidase
MRLGRAEEVSAMRVLVVYATAHGSTKGIAERIAARMTQRSVAVTCAAVSEVGVDSGYAAGYDAVVLGSAIHGQRWLPEADRYARDHLTELAGKPVWLFSVGMPAALGPRLRGMADREGPKAVAPYGAVRPRGTKLFSGVVRADHLPRLGRAIFRLMGGRYGDFRDMAAVDAWTDDIVDQLRTAASPGPAPVLR